jgi:hypothetical protein
MLIGFRSLSFACIPDNAGMRLQVLQKASARLQR